MIELREEHPKGDAFHARPSSSPPTGDHKGNKSRTPLLIRRPRSYGQLSDSSLSYGLGGVLAVTGCVILSGAKDQRTAPRGILRSAQDDN